ncbi:ferric uptake regulator, Fur family [Clostridium sp. DL-VIII]|uniref:Fur family transcriptional regulator n=1 Tax=Clostridium sp. DL-VIII TaxID=641107 RepID=UPI00023AF76A|nr:Fur family transcriptional regulator [Clostridium sp. DL-VIII]EHI96838.1 ferric uptake regulator, Fur family [Clostridium sp. DL-VIII]
MNHYLNNIYEQLKIAGIALTCQRKIILQVLFENKDNHLSVEEIYHYVRIKIPDTGLATVYRTLELLYQLGIVRKLTFGDNVARYEMVSSESEHKHHFICKECGTIIDVKDDFISIFNNRISNKYGFYLTEQSIVFEGLCSQCLEKNATLIAGSQQN